MSTTTNNPGETAKGGTPVPTAAPDPDNHEPQEIPAPGGKLGDRFPLPAPGGSGGSSPAGVTWAIDAQTLKCIKQQESNLPTSPGDEVYLASLTLRATPGVAGSTVIGFHDQMVNITKVKTGTTHAIPDNMGRVAFGNVVSRSLEDVLAGRNPEIIGTMTVVMEADLTRKAKITNLLTQAAAEVRPIVAGLVEPLGLQDITNSQQLSARFADAARDIQQALTPSVGQMILAFLGALGDPDDFIAGKLNLFVAVAEALAPLVDQALGSAVPSSLGVAGALRPRTYTQRFTGDGATYDLTFRVVK